LTAHRHGSSILGAVHLHARPLACALFALAGCAEEIASEGEIVVTTGLETDTWSAAPEPVKAKVDKITEAGRAEHLALPVPAERFGMGRGEVGSYELIGEDADGRPRVRGRTLLVDPAGFADAELPLFVGRVDRFCRPPGELLLDHGSAPAVDVLAGRAVLLAGAERSSGNAESELYDLGYWEQVPGPLLECGGAHCRFQSLAVLGAIAVGFGDGWASWFDFDSGIAGELDPPEGVDFADIVGAPTLHDPLGNAWVVGPARSGEPTAWVLRLDGETGEVTGHALAEPRERAATTWVAGRGLLVVGGSDAGPGGEILREGEPSFEPLELPPDPTRGAALVSLDQGTALRLGGETATGGADSVEIDLGCAEPCAAEPAGDAVPLTAARGFAAGSLGILVVGADADGETRAYAYDDGAARELELRVRRRGATALELPTGQLAVVGGERLDGGPAGALELITP
jgi:hypothetical protein